MIVMPPDGREVIGRKIEGLAYHLDDLVTEYLSMLSIDDRLKGEAKVKATIGQYPLLVRVLGLR